VPGRTPIQQRRGTNNRGSPFLQDEPLRYRAPLMGVLILHPTHHTHRMIQDYAVLSCLRSGRIVPPLAC
jgi:hypothetical protein